MESQPLYPPLPEARERLTDLRRANLEQLDNWRSSKDDYMRNYVMLGRWGQDPRHPAYREWMVRLTYSPSPGQPDTRLPDPREVFAVSSDVQPYLPQNSLWHCVERLRHLREDAIHQNFDPAKLALDVQMAVYSLFALSESLEDRLIQAISQDRGSVSAHGEIESKQLVEVAWTRPMSKSEAAKYLKCPHAKKVAWINKCVTDGTLRIRDDGPRTRQSHQFNLDAFPPEIHDKLKASPTK